MFVFFPSQTCYIGVSPYRLGMVNSNTVNSNMVNLNTVNSKFHLIRSFFEIFERFLSFHVYNALLIQTQLIQSFINSK